ncbi:hypothetical protein Tco_1573144, partial [Tanacetum coccineum]
KAYRKDAPINNNNKENKSGSKVVKNVVVALKKKVDEVTPEAAIKEMNKVKLNDDIINASADVGKKEQSTKQKKGTKMKKLVVRKTLKSV